MAATSDGGYIALALSDSPSGILANWLLKLNASGRPQWQREIECPNGAPGDYALGVSTQQLSDGGYILAGAFSAAVDRTSNVRCWRSSTRKVGLFRPSPIRPGPQAAASLKSDRRLMAATLLLGASSARMCILVPLSSSSMAPVLCSGRHN